MSSECDKRAAIVVVLRAWRSPPEIAQFLGLPKSLVYRTKRSYDDSENSHEFCPSRKEHCLRLDAKRIHKFIAAVEDKVNGNPGKSMRALAKEMGGRASQDDLQSRKRRLRIPVTLFENASPSD